MSNKATNPYFRYFKICGAAYITSRFEAVREMTTILNIIIHHCFVSKEKINKIVPVNYVKSNEKYFFDMISLEKCMFFIHKYTFYRQVIYRTETTCIISLFAKLIQFNVSLEL